MRARLNYPNPQAGKPVKRVVRHIFHNASWGFGHTPHPLNTVSLMQKRVPDRRRGSHRFHDHPTPLKEITYLDSARKKKLQNSLPPKFM
jgi:hypothetical protein